MLKHLFLFLLCLLPSLAMWADDKEFQFSDGFFIVNEDWYGHNNSTINWFGHDGQIVRRVVQTVNGANVQLGCTAPVGVIAGGKMFVTSKQEQDPGQSVVGARLTVLDAMTMKVVKQWTQFPNGGDGRDVCAVSDSKVYVGTTGGIYVLDTKAMEFTAPTVVGGTERDPDVLYNGQVGTILSVGGKVYACSQSQGLLVIDPVTDKVVEAISVPADAYAEGDKEGSLSFGSAVYKSGYIWLSVSAVSGNGAAKDVVVKFDPATKAMTTIPVTKGCYGPANSWYAWTPDGFCASQKDDYLFWNGGPNSWFAKQTIYRFDIKTGETTLVVDLQNTSDNIYGACLRVNPMTGDIITGLSMGQPYGNNYEIRIYTADGDLRYTYQLNDGNYWFPSIPVFPQVERKLVADSFDEAIVPLNGDKVVDVTDAAHDNFLTHALMGKTILEVADTSIVAAMMDDGNTLRLTGKGKGKTTVSLRVRTDADSVVATVPVSVAFQYLIGAEAVTPGTVQFSGLGYYSPGDTALIAATPEYGYEFSRWTDGVDTPERKVIADADKTLKAEVRKRKFTLNVVAGNNGTVSPVGEMEAEYLDTISLTAVPNEHYVFARWSDGVKASDRDYVVTKDIRLSASFEGIPDSVKLSVMPAGAGIASGSKTVKYGSQTYVTSRANKGYKFVRWSDGVTTTGRYVRGEGKTVELIAIFEPISYTLTVTASPAEGGTVTGGGTYTYGADASVTATAAENYVFSGWSDGVEDAERTVIVESDVELVANFKKEEQRPTSVDQIRTDAKGQSFIYDLSGRRLRSADGCRVYIKDGRLRIGK